MADVKWIKLMVGMFDGKSFKKIKRAKIGGESYRDKLTAIWFELMDFAGKCNHSGAFIDSHEIPFASLDDIAIMIDRETDELELCMSFFVNEGMIVIVDDVYMLSNWSQYQNEAGLDEIRRKNRERQAKFRAKNKLLLESGKDNATVTLHNAVDIDIEKDIDKEKDNENDVSYHDSSTNRSKPTRHKYGRYENVLFTDEEFEKLKTEFPDYMERIERLSEYIASTGKKYKNHLATIRAWARKDKKVGANGVAITNEKSDLDGVF